jgi:arylsulfatase A-like enzyme
VDYTNANAPAGWTRPAMSAIFTGLFPHAFGFAESRFPNKDHPRFTERLRAAGYRTFLFSSNPYVSSATGLDQGFDHICYVSRRQRGRLHASVLAKHAWSIARMMLSRRVTLKVISDMLVDQAARVLRRLQSTDGPFFMYVHIEVHHPYLSNRQYLKRVLDPTFGEQDIRRVETLQRACSSMYDFARGDLSEDERECNFSILNAMYDASFLKSDEHIARLLSILHANCTWADTAVIVTSDHGEFIGERGLVSHGLFPYEEMMHVPLLVKYPQEMNKTGSDHRLASTIDLGPTICELAGVPHSPDLQQARSLLHPATHEFVTCERHNFETGFEQFRAKNPHVPWDHFNLGYVVGLKDTRYKYVWTSAGPEFLFDLAVDPGETGNLSQREPAILTGYRQKLEDWKQGMTIRAGILEETYEDAVMAHLRDLGYVE